MNTREFKGYITAICDMTRHVGEDFTNIPFVINFCASKLNELNNDGYITRRQSANLFRLIDPTIASELESIEHFGCFTVSLPFNAASVTKLRNSHDRSDPIRRWLDNNAKGRWEFGGKAQINPEFHIMFTEDEDATLFLLTFAPEAQRIEHAAIAAT